MTYPEQIREDLNTAIANAVRKYRKRRTCVRREHPPTKLELIRETFALNQHDVIDRRNVKQFRRRIATLEDIIRTLMFMDGGRLDKELIKAGIPMTASGFIKRRKEINAEIFLDILREFNAMHPASLKYRGMNVYAIDGSTVNLVKNEDSPTYVCHAGAPQGFNQFHINPLYDLLNKRYVNCEIQPEPNKDEVGALREFLLWHNFENGSLIIGDRLYGTYNTIATFQEIPANVYFLLRLKHGQGAMREVAKLPMKELDQNISFTLSTTQTAEDKAKGHILIQKSGHVKKTGETANTHRWDWGSPYYMSFRVVRFKLESGVYETLATSLPDDYTPDELRALYHARWGLETAFRELKYNYGLINVHGKSDDFVRQEINAALLTATVCSTIINEVVARQPDESIYEYAIDRSMAIFLIKEFFRTPGADGDRLMRDIARYTVPIRPGRADVRNLRVKGFTSFVYRVAA